MKKMLWCKGEWAKSSVRKQLKPLAYIARLLALRLGFKLFSVVIFINFYLLTSVVEIGTNQKKLHFLSFCVLFALMEHKA